MSLSARVSLTVIAKPSHPGSTIKLLNQWTLKAATNDDPAKVLPPSMGKHISSAYRPNEDAMYLFGGDGNSWRGVGDASGGFHFGKILLGGSVPVFQHFYPYPGIAGKIVPGGYDCVPFVYDSLRDEFWQMGGYVGGAGSGWIGIPTKGGVWNYKPCPPDKPLEYGEWIQVSPTYVSYSGTEGMAARHHARTDLVIGMHDEGIWTYNPKTDARGYIRVTWPAMDWREAGRWNTPAYDEQKDEIIIVEAVKGKVVAIPLKDLGKPDLKLITGRVIGQAYDPYPAVGGFPNVFVPHRREMVCFYYNGLGRGGQVHPHIFSINVDTGATSAAQYPASIPSFINQAVLTNRGTIFGTISHSGMVAEFGWGD